METFIWTIIGISSFFGFAFTFPKVDKTWKLALLATFCSIGFILSLVFTGYSIAKTGPPNFHSTDFNLRTEIRTEYIDSTEVSRDTVYIFTPKKK